MAHTPASDGMTVWTIGHSTRPLEELIGLLKQHGVTRLVDVRTMPRSRTTPQFNRDMLPAALEQADLAYQHLAALGGLRKPRPDSPNGAWRNPSFRGYADHMQTPEFEAGLEQLLAVARQAPSAIMCAELLPWRCHRSLIADALVVRGVAVEHIFNATTIQPHRLRSWARVDGARITYPPDGEDFFGVAHRVANSEQSTEG